MGTFAGKVMRTLGAIFLILTFWIVAYAIIEFVWFFATGSRVDETLRFIIAVVVLAPIAWGIRAFFANRKYKKERAEYRAGLRDTISE